MSSKTPPTLPGGIPTEGIAKAQFDAVTVTLEAAGEGMKIPTFDAIAYTGGPMRPNLTPPFPHPVVVDLDGMMFQPEQTPMLRDHDFGRHVGHANSVRVEAGQLFAAGIISGGGPDAIEVVDASGKGFKWKLSIGADLDLKAMEFVPLNNTVQVNGRRVAGPVFVSRRSTLNEISFLTKGADGNTVARIAAQAAGDTPMTFEDYLEARGEDAAALTDDRKARLQAAYNAEYGEPDTSNPEPAPKADPVPAPAPQYASLTAAAVQELQREQVRMVKLQAACAGHPDIFEKAVEGNWDIDRAKDAVDLAKLRAGQPKAPHGIVRDNTLSQAVLEAAVCTSLGLNVEKDYDSATLEAAHSRYRGRIGLQELMLESALANGYQSRSIGSVRNDTEGVMRAAFGDTASMRATEFSTVSLPGIMSNTGNKLIVASYNNVEAAWRTLSSMRTVRDFKAVTSYRLTGNGEYEQLPPDGEIKHGTLGEAEYGNQAKTYAKMFGITRTDIYNDDLGALNGIRRVLGRGSAMAKNTWFWTEFLDNASFFTSGRGNYLEGATTPLSVASLSAAKTQFMQQTDEEGQPIGIQPSILLVPPQLEETAKQLVSAGEIRDGGASGPYFTSNPHVGQYRVVVSQYLANSLYTGYSATAWYLLADPSDLPVIETALLDGRDTPVIESTEADFRNLGMLFRGYDDFGFAKQEYRAGLKVKGAA